MIRFISEFWSALCVVPLVVLVAYQILKPWIGWSFDHELGAPIGISWVAFVLLGMLLFLLLISFSRRNVFRCGALSTGLLVFLLGWSSVMLQKVGDGDVESLFSLGWQEAGSYAATVGLRNTISSWNSSANPQGGRGFDEPSPIWVKSTTHQGLRSNPGETWVRSDRRFNNRMNLHPPVYALALSLWMRIVGQSAYVSLAFGLAIKCLLVILVAVWTRERLAGDRRGQMPGEINRTVSRLFRYSSSWPCETSRLGKKAGRCSSSYCKRGQGDPKRSVQALCPPESACRESCGF